MSLPDTSDWRDISVVVDGQGKSAVTDSLGNFSIDSVYFGGVHIIAGKLFYGNADTLMILDPGGTSLNVIMHLTSVFGDTFRALSTARLTSASTDIGNIGVPARFVQPGDSGFSWLGIQQLKESSLMIGVDTTRVSDAARYILSIQEDNLEHNFSTRSDIVPLASGTDSTANITAFDDSRANTPPGIPSQPLQILATQRTSTYGASGNDGYMIVQLDITSENHLPLQNLLVGWFVDWQAGGTSSNRGGVTTFDNQIAGLNGGVAFPAEIAYQKSAGNTFVGVIPLSQVQFRAARIASVAQEIAPTA
ncbi:MAG TPA: hypothetical protein VKS81_11635, partial [Bacteroidota bacterium]|nr:hypothetical protein [Bacteroidota bacterium]